MFWRTLRNMALIGLCGGMMFQTTTGCDALLAPILSTLVSTVISGAVGSLFMST